MKCVILDDEPFAHQVLAHYIGDTPSLTLVASFRNAVEAYEYIGKNPVDLLFLDIEMPLINGVDFLKALPAPPKTIFTTAYKQYAFDGFELNAVDYLLKPFSYERFLRAVGKLTKVSDDRIYDTLLVKGKEGKINLKQVDILYIEGCKDYVKIITPGNMHLMYQTLKSTFEKLNQDIFLQCHRSYIVNRMNIIQLTYDSLILANKTFIPIGPSYKKELIAIMNR
ncbi:MAG: response regulator transcription factor [Pedobacter sp.]|nr:MAG: response regulator transcription factor [Pedobacter sp.]